MSNELNSVEPGQGLPRIGMLATVRNRRGVISNVNPYDGPDGRLHLVDIEYNDGTTPLEQSLLWEREPNARLLPPGALPDPLTSDPMSHDDLDALVRLREPGDRRYARCIRTLVAARANCPPQSRQPRHGLRVGQAIDGSPTGQAHTACYSGGRST